MLPERVLRELNIEKQSFVHDINIAPAHMEKLSKMLGIKPDLFLRDEEYTIPAESLVVRILWVVNQQSSLADFINGVAEVFVHGVLLQMPDNESILGVEAVWNLLTHPEIGLNINSLSPTGENFINQVLPTIQKVRK